MNRMYLEINNAGRCLLVTNGANWYNIEPTSNGFIGDIDIYADDLNDEEIAESIRQGTTSGAIYNADEMIEDACNEDNEISEYYGMTLPDIDRLVNYEDDLTSGDIFPKTHDKISWIEI